MQVIATAVGFHGKLRQVGDKFDVADGSKGSWYEPVGKPPARQPSAAEAKAKTEAEAKAKAEAEAKAASGKGKGADDLV